MATGRPPSCTCGECPKCKRNERMRKRWHGMTLDERRAAVAKRDKARVRAHDMQRAYHPDRVERRRIITKVHNAVRDGKLIKEACLFCDVEKVEAHHHDYSKPLAVTWLCPFHHRLVHGRVV